MTYTVNIHIRRHTCVYVGIYTCVLRDLDTYSVYAHKSCAPYYLFYYSTMLFYIRPY